MYGFVAQIQYNYGAIQITSGYRNPVHNVAVSSTPRIDSRHQFGDAVDIKPWESPSGALLVICMLI
jgi:uncharacterized protein YcbK (DUF882 family)